jgi:hypothetical protein
MSYDFEESVEVMVKLLNALMKAFLLCNGEGCIVMGGAIIAGFEKYLGMVWE